MTLTDETAERTMSPKWMWGVTGALAVVVLGGAGAVVAVDAQGNDRGAVRAIAESYVAAVESGDVARAEELFDGGETTGAEVTLSPEVVGSAALIAYPELEQFRVDFDGGRAAADVRFELDGEPYSDRLQLRRDDDGVWQVTAGLRYEVELDSASRGALAFRGMDRAFPGDTESLTMYAGAYTFVSHNKYFITDNDAEYVAASPYGSIYATDWLRPGPGYEAEVQRQVETVFAECAESNTLVALRSCGIEAPEPDARFASSSEVSISVDMERAPTARVEPGITGWASLADRGSFDLTYTGRDASGQRVTDQMTASAQYADLEIAATEDGLSVEVANY